MPLPASLEGRLALPAIAAPMFLTSGPDLVIACCRNGVMGSFPALNCRTTEALGEWLDRIEAALGPNDAPYAVNLIVHKTNPRLEADLAVCVERRVPAIITSLGAVPDLVERVHGYGGVVFHDVISKRHAEKARDAGADGLILVSAGAGGHAGTLNPFAFLAEARSLFDGALILAGCLSTGRDVAAARMMGADLAYLGTRFIATQEATAHDDHKAMIGRAGTADVVYTKNVSGIDANFLRESLAAHGIDPDAAAAAHGFSADELLGEAKAWRDLWSAGQGVGAIRDMPGAGELCRRLAAEYRAAVEGFAG